MTPYLKLRRRHQKFVDAYVETGHLGKAAIAAGYKGNRAARRGWELMQIPEVSAAVADRTKEAIQAAGVSEANVVRQLARIAHFDPRKLLDANGLPLPLHQLPDEVATALGGVEIEETWGGTGPVKVKTARLSKYRNPQQVEALKMLMQYLKLLTEQHELSGPGGVPLAPPTLNFGFKNGGPGRDLTQPDSGAEGT